MTERQSPPVELDELLAAEFNYIAQTAAQTNEDRARVSSFYMIAVGSLVAALFGTQLFEPEKFTGIVKLMFSGLFILLTILGASTVMQLAQLRSAWYESVRAMNQLKDFAMKQNPELQNAFRWKTSTIPDKYKMKSVSYYQALEVSIIDGLTLAPGAHLPWRAVPGSAGVFGAAMFFLQQAFFSASILTWVLCALLGVLAVITQMAIYRRLLK